MFVLTKNEKNQRILNLAKYRSIAVVDQIASGIRGHYYLVAYIDKTGGHQQNRVDLDVIAEFEDEAEAYKALNALAGEIAYSVE